MDGLLTLCVALATLAVITQACVLVAIYLKSRRLSNQVDRFISDTRELMVPVKAITENLQVASTNIMEIGVSAREQFRRVEAMVADTGEALQTQLGRMEDVTKDVADRINSTADLVQSTVVRPVREVAAVAKGFGRGFSFLFRGNKKPADSASDDEDPLI